MNFFKYEGLGNDFIVVDGSEPMALTVDDARQLCDRHFGIGADGVLLVTPAISTGARARMTVLNADGSRPEMCGNGLRCVVLHLALADHSSQAQYRVDTDAGVRACEIARTGVTGDVTIEMGEAELNGKLVASHQGRPYEFQRVSTGNPHAILFDANFSSQAIDEFAPQVSAGIVGGSNVEFVRPRSGGGFDVVVWERGVGRTLACGTGACATAAAAVAAGKVELGQPVSVVLPGGGLTVTVRGPGLQTTLRGPARQVFQGQLPR